MKKIFFLIYFLLSVCVYTIPTHCKAIADKQRARPDLTVVGFVHFDSGIGRQTIGLIDCLKDDLKINWIPTDDRYTQSRYNDVAEEVRRILEDTDRAPGNVAILEDLIWQKARAPYTYVPKESLIKIAYTMLESTAIPKEWVAILNTEFNAAVVPDQFLVKVYKKCGVKIPVFVLPLGVYLEDFFKLKPPQEPSKVFVFGNAAAGWDRKNNILLLDAFARAFGNNPNVRLKLTARMSDYEVLSALQERVKRYKLTNVEWSVHSLSWTDYVGFIKNLNCYVVLSKGEGFGIPVREALAAGIPAIIADNTAHSTVCKSGYVRSVPSLLREPAHFYIFGGVVGEYANCSVDDAAKALIDVYRNYGHYRDLALQGREWVKQYRYSTLKKRYLNLVKPKKLILGDRNEITDEYLMTKSKRLYDKYRQLEA